VGIPNNSARSPSKISQHEHEDVADARRVISVSASGLKEETIESNSSVTTLDVGENFVGSWVNSAGIGSIIILCLSDVSGNLLVEHSPDQQWIVKTSNFPIAQNSPTDVIVSPVASFFRIRYENGATPQTEFLLQTTISTKAHAPINQPINSQIEPNVLAPVNRSIIVGFDETLNPINISSSNTGSLKVIEAGRPSEIRGRIRHILPIVRTDLVNNTPYIVHPITPGYTLYISSFLVSALNISAQDGQFQLRDGTQVFIDFLIPSRVTGSSPSAFSITAPTLPEPLPFTTTLNFLQITGDVEIAGYLIGYEEPM